MTPEPSLSVHGALVSVYLKSKSPFYVSKNREPRDYKPNRHLQQMTNFANKDFTTARGSFIQMEQQKEKLPVRPVNSSN